MSRSPSRALIRALLAAVGAGAIGVLLASCIQSGPPTAEQVNAQFAESVEPAWQVDIDGLFGEPVVRDGLVFAYADDEADGMRLEVRALEDGKLLWEHVASPGGAWSNPIIASSTAASRSYPFPAIEPIVMERGEGDDAQSVVVFFERSIPGADEDTLVPDDLLRVADARTGELLEVTFEPYDEFAFRPYGTNDNGDVFLNAQTPGHSCGDGRVCFFATDGEDSYATARLSLDVEVLELEYTPSFYPSSENTTIPDLGPGYVTVLTDESNQLGRFENGELLWQVDYDVLFDDPRTSVPEFIDFTQVGDVLLIQGYQSILETLDPDLPHTLDLDFAASRTLVAIDPDTAEVIWRAPGADMLCTALSERPIAKDATTIPVCVATAGNFVYDYDSESMLEQTDIEASIAELTVADGSLGWNVPEAGEIAIANLGRLLDPVFASRGDYAVVAPVDSTVDDGEDATGDVQLVHLTDGETLPVGEDATFVCKSERDDVEVEFEGSAFSGGLNPLTTGYPGSWYHFPCDSEGEEIDSWSKGAVRVAGYPEQSGDGSRFVLPLDGSLVAFDLG